MCAFGFPTVLKLSRANASAFTPVRKLFNAKRKHQKRIEISCNAKTSDEFAVIYSQDFLNHKTPLAHPECSERVAAIEKALKAASFSTKLRWIHPTPVKERNPLPLLQNLHPPAYISFVEKLAAKGGGPLDMDTFVSPDTYEVSLLAVNAWVDGVQYALQNQGNAFVCARPPGHHATKSRGMGFCIFNNCIAAAKYALDEGGCERVVIVDWDVHHGNGTQDFVEDDARISLVSMHQSPCYPGTGSNCEHGAHGNILNLPLAPGSAMAEYKSVFDTEMMPFVRASNPDLILVSAGYDATAADPLASQNLAPSDFTYFTQQLLTLSKSIVFGLEGGYDLESLAQSVVCTVAPCVEREQFS